MGCIIWGDDEVLNSKLASTQKRFFLDFSLTKSQEKFTEIIDNQANTKEKFNLPVSKFSFTKKENTIAERAAAYTRKGEGSVALLRSNQTYKMLLDGKRDLYNVFWSEILSAVNRPKKTGDEWTLKNTNLAFTTQPLDLQLTTTSTQDLYVHAHTRDWQTLQIAQNIRANHAHQAQKSPENFRGPTLQKNVVRRLPLWWFYVGLLVCWAVLWLEEKI